MSTYYDNLERWHELKAAISRLQAEERALREGLFHGTFPTPQEGTNTVELPDGRKLKGKYQINRKIDTDALEKQPKGWLPKSVLDSVLKYEPKLVLSAYRKLPEDQRKKLDGVLDIKPGLPSLDLVEAP